MNTIRSFIAIELPDEVRRIMGAGIAELSLSIPEGRVKWVKPQNIHLTLKFLGDIEPGLVPELTASIEEVTAISPRHDLTLGEMGAFPNLRTPRVIWVGLHGDTENLRALQRRIDRKLSELGFPVEKKDFQAHLTLGRVRDRVNRADLVAISRALTKSAAPEGILFKVARLSLMKSTLTPGGPVYELLSEAHLTENRTP